MHHGYRRSDRGMALQRTKRRAFVLVTIMIIIVILAMMLIGLLYRLHGSKFTNQGSLSDQQALLAAQSGLAEAMANLSKDSSWAGNPSEVSMAGGQASYTVSLPLA